MSRWWWILGGLATVSCDAGQVRRGGSDASTSDGAVARADADLRDAADLDATASDLRVPGDVGLADARAFLDATSDGAPFPIEVGPRPDAGGDASADAQGDSFEPVDFAVDSFMEPGPCGAWAGATDGRGVADPELREASGLALGRDDPSVLWSHNDSGDTARIFALDAATGGDRGQVQLTGVNAHDVEDIAAAGCPDDPASGCLWVADLGDNDAERNDVAVWIVREPVAPGPGQAGEAAVAIRVPIRYAGGAVNVEALLVAPAGDRLWLLEKGGDADATRIFEVVGPFVDRERKDARVVGTFAAPGLPVPRGRLVTGADLSPAGDQVLVRVYTGTWAYTFGAGQGVADLGAIAPIVATLGPLSEPQGEAVSYAADGRSFFTLSEAASGSSAPPLHFYGCR